MNKSFLPKNFFIKTLIIILPILLISIFFFSLYFKNLIDSETTQKFKYKGDAVLNSIASKIMVNKLSAELLANNIETFGIQLNKNQLVEILKKDIETNKEIFGAGIWFEPYVYRPNIKFFGPYCYRNKKNNILSTHLYSTKEYSYTEWEWYNIAKNKQRAAVWSMPYYDPVQKTTFITISVPMYKENEFIGVVTTDFVLSTIQDLIKETKISKNGWTFVIDKKGNYIAHKDKNKIIKKNILKEDDKSFVELGRQILSQKRGLTTFRSKSNNNLVYFSPIADSGLFLASVMPTNDLYGLSMLSIIGAGFLLSIVLIILLNITMIRQEKFNQKRLKSILDNMNNCVIVINKKAIIEYCNPAVGKLFSYSPSELLNKNVDILFPENNIIDRIINGISFDTIGIKKNRDEFPVEIKFREVFVKGGNKYILDIYDISKHKEIERMKDEFISSVSHELRTPLTSIQGSLGLIRSNALGPVPQKISELIDIAYNNCGRLIHLINYILDIKKIEAGQMALNLEKLDIVSIIKETITENTPYAQKYNVNFAFDSRGGPIYVYADKFRLIQIITNLLSNAAKFSFPNETVKITTSKTGKMVRTSVSNHGETIPDEFKSKIFQKFLQLNSSNTRSTGGTGLGLNICKTLIEKFGGTIDFESTPDSLTIFYFDLPMFSSGKEKTGLE